MWETLDPDGHLRTRSKLHSKIPDSLFLLTVIVSPMDELSILAALLCHQYETKYVAYSKPEYIAYREADSEPETETLDDEGSETATLAYESDDEFERGQCEIPDTSVCHLCNT